MLLDLRSLQEAHDLAAAGAALSGGNADLSLFGAIAASGAGSGAGNADLALLEAMAGQGVAASGGGGSLALLVSLVGSASASASGAGTLGLLEALAAAGGPAAGGAAFLSLLEQLAADAAFHAAGAGDLTASEAFSAAGTARVAGFAELQIWTLGFMVVAVQVPLTTGSYILSAPVSGAQREYIVSPVDDGGGLVQVPPDELARFLRAVPGSQVVDPAQAELFRIARPYIAQVAGPFRGD